MSSKRIEWIDIAKGAGMILVILGHCLPYGRIFCNLIFAFHMPLFFILSGMVYKDIPLKEIFIKRFRSLIIPYILFCILGTLISFIMGDVSLRGLISDLYYGNPVHIYVSSVWFLIAMFGVILLFSIIRKIKNSFVQYGIVIFIMGLGIVYGFYNTHGIIGLRLPLDLDVVPMATAFFAFGFYLKKHLADYTEKFKSTKLLIGILILGGIIVVFTGVVILNHSVNLHAITYRNPAFYLIESLLGSLALILLSCKISGISISKPLVWIGKNTIYLLGAQAIGIRLSVAAINRVFNKEFELYGLSYPYVSIAFVTTTAFAVLFTIIIKSVWGFVNKKEAK